MVRGDEVRRELLRLVGGGAVADGEQRDVMARDEVEHGLRGRRALRLALRDLEHAVREHAACRVDDGHLAARAVAGIEPHDDAARERRLQEELSEIRAEDMDGLRLCVLRELAADLALERGEEQAFLAVRERRAQLVREDGAAAVEMGEELVDGRLVVDVEADAQESFLLAAVDGEDAVRGQRAHGLRVVRVHEERLRLLALRRVRAELRAQRASLPEALAHLAAQARVLRGRLRDDVARAGECVLRGRHALGRVDEGGGVGEGIAVALRLQEHGVRERLEPALARLLRPRAALLLVGEVEILELLQLRRALDGRAQLIRELSLRVDGLYDFLLTLDEAAQVGEALLEDAELLVLERARRLLAVARDERHGVARVEQLDGLRGLLRADAELRCDMGRDVCFFHYSTSVAGMFSAKPGAEGGSLSAPGNAAHRHASRAPP